jgi:formamidase
VPLALSLGQRSTRADTREQACLLLSAAPVESRVAALVDIPNALVTLGLPTGIFNFDILPRPGGLQRVDRGQAAIRSDGVQM